MGLIKRPVLRRPLTEGKGIISGKRGGRSHDLKPPRVYVPRGKIESCRIGRIPYHTSSQDRRSGIFVAVLMDDHPEKPITDLSTIEAIRKRPGMYVGSTAFFGFINYLVYPIALMLGQRPTRIAVSPADGRFIIEFDVALPVEEMPSGRISPFEEIPNLGQGLGFEGTVLNALSERLIVEVQNEHGTETLVYRRGFRESRYAAPHDSSGPKTNLTFEPDASIFTVTDLSPSIFKSYLRRLSFLHRRVRFSISFGEETEEFYAERGVVDLFAAVSAPYQLLHEPIHIVAEDGPLYLKRSLPSTVGKSGAFGASSITDERLKAVLTRRAWTTPWTKSTGNSNYPRCRKPTAMGWSASCLSDIRTPSGKTASRPKSQSSCGA